MESEIFLAQLWGFSLVIVFLSLLVMPQRAKSFLQLLEQDGMLLCHGVVRLVLGLAMVLHYNVWDASWKTIVTVLGWLLIVSGLVLLYTPRTAQRIIARLKNSDWISLVFVFGVLLGCVLIYFSYTA